MLQKLKLRELREQQKPHILALYRDILKECITQKKQFDSVVGELLYKEFKWKFKQLKGEWSPKKVENYLDKQRKLLFHIQQANDGQMGHQVRTVKMAFQKVFLPVIDIRYTPQTDPNYSNLLKKWRDIEVWGNCDSGRKVKLQQLNPKFQSYIRSYVFNNPNCSEIKKMTFKLALNMQAYSFEYMTRGHLDLDNVLVNTEDLSDVMESGNDFVIDLKQFYEGDNYQESQMNNESGNEEEDNSSQNSQVKQQQINVNGKEETNSNTSQKQINKKQKQKAEDLSNISHKSSKKQHQQFQ